MCCSLAKQVSDHFWMEKLIKWKLNTHLRVKSLRPCALDKCSLSIERVKFLSQSEIDPYFPLISAIASRSPGMNGLNLEFSLRLNLTSHLPPQ